MIASGVGSFVVFVSLFVALMFGAICYHAGWHNGHQAKIQVTDECED